jgi:DNA polymerase III sliding clamp (beta) subunit (PCNA family)
LQGVFIAPHAGELETAAADGFVLSHVAIKSEQAKDAKGAVYSAEAINRVKRALKPADDEDIHLGIEKSGLTITAQRDKATIMLHIPTVTDQFVDYKQLLKIPQSLTINLPTSTFEKMIKRMKSMGGNVYFQVTGGCFWFMIQNEETGKSMESMPVEVTEESPLMAFQVSTLNDVVKACAPNGHVTIAFPQSERSPLFFKGQAEALAMPLAHEMKESPFKNLQPSLI